MQGGAQGPDAQMKMMMKMMINQAKSSDQLFEETGVDDDQLNFSIQKLDLEKDEEFLAIARKNMQEVMMKAQKANPGMGGGMPMGGMF